MKSQFSLKKLMPNLRAAVCFCLVWVCFASRGLFAAGRFDLHSTKPDGGPIRVTAKMEVGGHLKISADKTVEPVPMSVVAQFSYDEQRLDDGTNPDHRLSIRLYDDAQAVIKIATQVTKPQLRENRKLIAAVAGKDSLYLASPSGPLLREELELIEIPGNTLVIDQLLPQADVETGHRWKPSGDALAQLLGLDSVGHTEAECVLVDVNSNVAEITIEGPLGGAFGGVATEIELKGKLFFDIDAKRPKSLLLAVREQRGIGQVGPGVNVVAKIKLNFEPQPESKLLDPEIVQAAKMPQSDTAPPLEYRSESKGYGFQYDRRWLITRDEPDLLVMRFVNRGDLVAQCNVAPLSKNLDQPLEMEDFQNEVQRALGKPFGKFERASQRTTESGLRILQATAVGMAEDVPIQWQYYLLHNHQGRALSVVFTMEGPQVEQFHDQDQALVESLKFLDSKVASGKTIENDRPSR